MFLIPSKHEDSKRFLPLERGVDLGEYKYTKKVAFASFLTRQKREMEKDASNLWLLNT